MQKRQMTGRGRWWMDPGGEDCKAVHWHEAVWDGEMLTEYCEGEVDVVWPVLACKVKEGNTWSTACPAASLGVQQG